MVNKEKQFIGVMIWFYSKTGISTMFNTGNICWSWDQYFWLWISYDKIIESFKWGIKR